MRHAFDLRLSKMVRLNRYRFQVNADIYNLSNANGVQTIDTTYTFPTGTWTPVALTLSGSTGTLDVNGTAVGSNAAMSKNPASFGDTSQNYIGKSQWSNDPYLNGSVDDFRVYNHALSAADIAALATQ